MKFRAPRRPLRSRILRIAALLLLVWTWLETVYIHHHIVEADREPPNPHNGEKIFIPILPWNNEYIFRTHFINQLRELAAAVGPKNIYISIYENGSYDGTRDALRDLRAQLDAIGVENQMTMEDISHQDLIDARPSEPTNGWIKMAKAGYEAFGIAQGDYALRRIHYLAQLRNRGLEHLYALAASGRTFDKILFLNDVVFSASDILTLLQTRDGQYAAACSLDFATPPSFYDTFALRDSTGLPALMQTWPFFRSAASRSAAIAHTPIPVRSCWNGAVAFDATPFYSTHAPLRFRGVPDSLAVRHVEGSECCLIHADNPLSARRGAGVWLNPRVRVGYCHPGLYKGQFAYDWDVFKHVCGLAYHAVNPATGAWVGQWRIAWGLWENRVRRWAGLGGWVDWKAKRRVEEWEREVQGNVEVGDMCVVDEMQLIEPKGWLHV